MALYEALSGLGSFVVATVLGTVRAGNALVVSSATRPGPATGCPVPAGRGHVVPLVVADSGMIGTGVVMVSAAGASGQARPPTQAPPAALAHWRSCPLVSQPQNLAPQYSPGRNSRASHAALGG